MATEWENMRYWSFKNRYAPRPEQIHIIDEIVDAMDMGFKNIILEAGTGIGKSAIAVTIANMVRDSYICTMTNQLQSQYLDDFADKLTEIKGRSNYACNYRGYCDDCQMEEDNEYKCYDCPYTWALRRALESKNIITNYDYLFYAGAYAGLFKPRQLLILDETHNFEKKIMNLVSNELNRKTIIRKYGFDIFETVKKGATLKSINNYSYWVNILERLIQSIKSQFPRNQKEAKRNQRAVIRYSLLIDHLTNDKWVIDLPTKKEIIADKDYSAGLKVEFKPIMIKEYTDTLLDFGETRLFLTGTLGNKEKFCNWIGIDPTETYYIYQKSPFPVEHRPILKEYVKSMSGFNPNRSPKWKDNKVLDKICEIIRKHPYEKGVIHTSSNQQAWWIKKALNSKNIWVAQGASREETINRFEKSRKPIVLIGAGIKDGVDFKGDKCRYQILFKMPFPSLASTQINIRKHYDKVWYAYQTIMPLMQAYGRGIRDMDDHCVMYVLDSDFDRLVRDYRYLFNEYFLEAIKCAAKPRPVPRPVKANGGK